MLQLTALLLVAQAQLPVPPPRGYVDDFAGVLEPAAVAHMEAISAEVREKTPLRDSDRDALRHR
ncbi:MAG TPA: hypothetical protein VM716_15640 [Gemmatimonadales bacterium]|nr:hypothetical protein [Gemmatimonadales bacterium]